MFENLTIKEIDIDNDGDMFLRLEDDCGNTFRQTIGPADRWDTVLDAPPEFFDDAVRLFEDAVESRYDDYRTQVCRDYDAGIGAL